MSDAKLEIFKAEDFHFYKYIRADQAADMANKKLESLLGPKVYGKKSMGYNRWTSRLLCWMYPHRISLRHQRIA